MIASRILFPFIILFAYATILTAQVGIGTSNPSSELEILGTNTGIPALELNPQSGPVGTKTGQLAVIGDLLYMYDGNRVKWLSVESTALQFGRKGAKQGEYMRLGGDVNNSGSGVLMPYNGTITAVTIMASGGDATHTYEVHKNGSAVASYALSGSKFNNPAININFAAGDYIHMYITSGSDVDDSAAMIWVKWRK